MQLSEMHWANMVKTYFPMTQKAVNLVELEAKWLKLVMSKLRISFGHYDTDC